MIEFRHFGEQVVAATDTGEIDEILLLSGKTPCPGDRTCDYCRLRLSHKYEARLPLRDVRDNFGRRWTYEGAVQEIRADDDSCWETIHRWTSPKIG